jgi:Mg2+/Co2+ transporter CorC
MVPRTEVVSVGSGMTREALVDHIARGGYSRVPVYRDNADDIVGILHVTDLLKSIERGGPISAAALAREALTVPKTLPADEVLGEMRRRGVREAGLVTFESLMERIVGDLGSTVTGSLRVNVLADGSAEIDGLVLVAEVNQQFDLHIDKDTYTTVGGYVLGRLGRRPQIGDVVDVEGRRLRVDALDGIRIARVWLSTPAMAIQSVAQPPTAIATNAAFITIEIARLAWMFRIVARLNRSAYGIFSSSSAISAMSAVSSAAALPATPIAMPTSAEASAGASLTPSPTMATGPNRRRSSSTTVTLSSGSSSARTSSTPSSSPMRVAVARPSPVSMTTLSTP